MLHKTCPTCKHQRPIQILGFSKETTTLAEEMLEKTGGHVKVTQWGHYQPRVKIEARLESGGFAKVQPYDERRGAADLGPGVHIEFTCLTAEDARKIIAAVFPDKKESE
jgi:hypothetical protein